MDRFGRRTLGPPRPILTFVISVLLLAQAAVMVAALAGWPDAHQLLGTVAAPTAWATVHRELCVLLLVASALGLFLGARWGWWGSGVVVLQQVMQHALVLLSGPALEHQLDAVITDNALLDQLLRSAAWFFVLVALQTPSVAEFCQLYTVSRRRALLWQLVLAAALVFVGAAAWVR